MKRAGLALLLSSCALLYNPDRVPFIPPDACVPVCLGMLCGAANGCGGICQSGSGCSCDCRGKVCGAGDGCGGICNFGSGCDCVPPCSQRRCGEMNGCGVVCDVADSGCTCEPACGGKNCGDNDGCGLACAPGSGCTPAMHRAANLGVSFVDGPGRVESTAGSEVEVRGTNFRVVDVKVR
jgi:hypothetical protein